jgi:hypothetical protein
LKAADRHAAEGDAAAYWRGFTVLVHFAEPTTIVGTVEALAEHNDRRPDGTFVRHPRVRIRDDDGQEYVIVVRQARLLAELINKAPVVGDRIRIIYRGPAERSAPGMSPTKEFRVDVQRAPAEVRTVPEVGTSGPENVPQPGTEP